MKNMHSSSSGQPEHSEKSEQTTRRFAAKHYLPDEEDTSLLHDLLQTGFAWEEAVTLLHMREHLYENKEVSQRMADDCHMQFAQWLYANGEMNEG